MIQAFFGVRLGCGQSGHGCKRTGKQPGRPMWLKVCSWDAGTAWTLTDLLGRPMGRITGTRGPGFTIHPAERAQHVMGGMPLGPYECLDDALRAVEKRTHGVCHFTPDQT